jgi:hypothetical protein
MRSSGSQCRTTQSIALSRSWAERPAQGIQAECRDHGGVQKNFAERVAEIRAKLAPGVEVWFQDEMRVGQKNKLTGPERFTPAGRAQSMDPIDLSVRCGLPRTWYRRRPRAAGLQLRSHAAPSRRDRNQSRFRSTRLRESWMRENCTSSLCGPVHVLRSQKEQNAHRVDMWEDERPCKTRMDEITEAWTCLGSG